MKLNRLKTILVEHEISQTEFAEKMDKSFGTINAWCTNRQQPSLPQLAQIAAILDINIKDLLIDTKED